VAKPTQVPWATSSFPGATSQESAGRLINVYAEPMGSQKPAVPGIAPKTDVVWRRCPGFTLHATTAQSGYRGGLIVGNLSYEIFNNEALTVDSAGTVVLLGALAGTKGISIARNNAGAPNIIAVDIDNGAFRLDTGGAPAAFNAGGILPQPKSVCFQDGYLFFGIADRRVFATGINNLTVNALTFVSVQAKSSDTLMRTIPFSGLLWIFCSSATEVWQDTAQPSPGFPYSRLVVLEYGLIQENAIGGFEDGFGVLHWVAQDFGVYQLTPGSFAPTKVSPPDLDRLIEAAVKAGTLLDVACYIFAGKKFFAISSSTWTWEFNLSTLKWNERQSLQANGSFGRWRILHSHPAFGKWIAGDTLSGNIVYIDDTNYTENNAVLRARMESAPVEDFPNRTRIARADFEFVVGVGQVNRSLLMNVSGAVAGTGGVVRLSVNSTVGVNANDTVQVAGIVGTTEANGNWAVTVVDATHIELQGTVFVHAYVSGGTATDVTATPEMVDPQVAISVSKDGGVNFGNPWVRSLGQQGKVKQHVTVTNGGLTTMQGTTWRWDVSAPVYCAFMGSTMSSDPRPVSG
jgi:hypothetical protein